MSEKLPYEEQLQQQWNDLPLPDENMAWADMKRRLEEDDDDGIVWWRRGCAMWGFLLLLLLAIGWWWLKPQQWFVSEKTKQQSHPEKTDSITNNKTYNNNSVTPSVTDRTGINAGNPVTTEDSELIIRGSKTETETETETGRKAGTGTETETGREAGGRTPRRVTIPGAVKKEMNSTVQKRKTEVIKTPGSNSYEVTGGSTGVKKEAAVTNNDKKQDPASLTLSQSASTEAKQDSIKKETEQVKIATIMTDPSVAAKGKDSLKKTGRETETAKGKTEAKKDSVKNKKFFFSAGIALQQQLPINGQKLTPYNAEGRKGSLADYIPSVYFRYNKEKEWFIQSEFRYGAPQYTKEFTYGNSVKEDSAGPNNHFTTTTLKKLKKTFYHQLSATFNYYVRPNWSIGGGITWNKFSSAITDQTITRRRRGTVVDSLIIAGIAVDKNSSVFSKSYFQALFETQYQWKRFSLGAKYSFGLEPYIRFTLAGGTEQQEKNSSIQVFLRYELWRSKTR